MNLRPILAAMLLAPALSGCAGTVLRPLGENLHIIKAPPSGAAGAAAANQEGLHFLERENLPAAEGAFLKAVNLDPAYGPAHNNLGRVYFCQRQYYLAAREFRAAEQLLPRSAEPLNNLGLIYETVNQLDDAAESYARAWSLAPQHPEVVGNYARVLLRKGERSDLVRQLVADLIFLDDRPEWTCWAREVQTQLGPFDGAPSFPSGESFETLPEPPKAASTL